MAHASVDTVFNADASPLLDALSKSEEGFGKISGKVASFAALAETAFGYITSHAANQITAMKKVSDQYGINIQTVQAFAQGIQNSGGSIESAVASLNRFEMTLGRAQMMGGRAAMAFKSMGLKVEELSTKNAEEQLVTVIGKLQEIEDPARRMRTALMTGLGPDVIAAFKKGGAGIAELKKELEHKGAMFDMIDAQRVKEAKLAVRELRDSLEVFAQHITIAVAPTVKKLAGYLEEATNWFNRHEALSGWIGKLAAAGGVLLMLGYAWQKSMGFLKTFTDVTGLSSLKETLHATAMKDTTSAARAETAAINDLTMAKTRCNSATAAGAAGIPSFKGYTPDVTSPGYRATTGAGGAHGGTATGLGWSFGNYGDALPADRILAAQNEAMWGATQGKGFRGGIHRGFGAMAGKAAGGLGVLGGGALGAMSGEALGGSLFGETGGQIGGALGGVGGAALTPTALAGIGGMMPSFGLAAGGSAAAVGGLGLAAVASSLYAVRAVVRAATGADVKEQADAEKKHDAERAATVEKLGRVADEQGAVFGVKQREAAFGKYARGGTGSSELEYAAQDKNYKTAQLAEKKAGDALRKQQEGKSFVGNMYSYWAGDAEKDKLEKEVDKAKVEARAERAKRDAIVRDPKQAIAESMAERWKSKGITDEADAAKILEDKFTSVLKGDPLRGANDARVGMEQALKTLTDPVARAKMEEAMGHKITKDDTERMRLESQDEIASKLGVKLSPEDELAKMELHLSTIKNAVKDALITPAQAAKARWKDLADAFGVDLTPAANKYIETLQQIDKFSGTEEEKRRFRQEAFKKDTGVTTESMREEDMKRARAATRQRAQAAADAGYAWTQEEWSEANRADLKKNYGLSGFKGSTQERMEEQSRMMQGKDDYTKEGWRQSVQKITGISETRGRGEVQQEGLTKLAEAQKMLAAQGLKMDDTALRKEIEKLVDISDTRSVQEQIAQNTADTSLGIQKMIDNKLSIDPESMQKAIGEKFKVGPLTSEAAKQNEKLANLDAATKQLADNSQKMYGDSRANVTEATYMRKLQQTLGLKTASLVVSAEEEVNALRAIEIATSKGYFGSNMAQSEIQIRNAKREEEAKRDKALFISEEGRAASRLGNVGKLKDRMDEIFAFKGEHDSRIGQLGVGQEIMDALDKFAPDKKPNAQVESATAVYDRISKAAASRSTTDPVLAVQQRIHALMVKQQADMRLQVGYATQLPLIQQLLASGFKALNTGLK